MTSLPGGVAAEPIADHPGAPLFACGGGFAQLTLNRPAEHNRIDPADIDALLPLLARLADQAAPAGGDTPLRALVITGSGERTFSSGYTLQAIVTELDDRFERMLDALETLPVLTIAALNGSVYGGATDLALCCDIRLGTPGLKMFMPAARFGLHYYPGGLRRYVTRLGLPAATKLMLTAMTIETEEMLRIGFLSEVVARSALTERVEAYLAQAAQTEPLVVGQMKRHLQALAERAADAPEAVALQASMARATAQSLRSPALKARLDALLRR
jgi:enoyl-CoA hydratase/carnithine racemase